MNKARRQALEAAGYWVGDASEFLELTPQQAKLVELRAGIATQIRRLREARGWTQQRVAILIGSSQSRVAKIEVGAREVSLDLMVKTLLALGGVVRSSAPRAPRRAKAAPKASSPKRGLAKVH